MFPKSLPIVRNMLPLSRISQRVLSTKIPHTRSMNKDRTASSSVHDAPVLPSLVNVTHVKISSRAEDIKSGLIDTFLNLERVDVNLFLARHLLKGRQSSPVVYGGQVIGQALSAATATVESGFVPNSLHSFFLKGGNVNQPILFQVDRIRDGRSFCTRIVKAIQNGEAIFTCQISFHKPEPDSIVHQLAMPEVPSPDSLDDWQSILEKASKIDLPPAAKAMVQFRKRETPPSFYRVFTWCPIDVDYLLTPQKDVKSQEPHDANKPQHHETFRSYVWVKANENIGDDPRLHAAAAAYITDATMIDSALGPHCRRGFIPSMALTLDHCIWMHTDQFRVDDWLLYENHTTIAVGGRALIEGKLWTRDGRLVFSTTQEALVRAPRSSTLNGPPKSPSASPRSTSPSGSDEDVVNQ